MEESKRLQAITKIQNELLEAMGHNILSERVKAVGRWWDKYVVQVSGSQRYPKRVREQAKDFDALRNYNDNTVLHALLHELKVNKAPIIERDVDTSLPGCPEHIKEFKDVFTILVLRP